MKNERALSIEKGDKHIYIPIGKKEMRISTEELAGPVPMDAPAFIKNNRTMLPLRAIAELFDMDVAWDGAARAVRISSADRYLTPTTILEYDPITDGCNKEVGVNSRKSSQMRALLCAHSPSLKNRGRFPRLQISFSSMTNPVMRA